MNMKHLALFTLLVPLLLVTGNAQAQSFRCDKGIASTQDSRAAILHKCGEPAMRDSYCREPVILKRKKQACVTVEEWTYNPGPGRFMIRVQFEQGEVVSIERGERISG